MEEVLEILPADILEKILHEDCLNSLEEIRIRLERPIELVLKEGNKFIPMIVHQNHLSHMVGILTQFSIYMMEEELRRGYVTIKGGHRIGIAGKVVTDGGKVKLIRDISSLNIRIAKEKKGIANKLIPYLYDRNWKNTMIIGPPQTGKTTLLRDLARLISSGEKELSVLSNKVGIVDERSEIAGCANGVPQFTFGSRLDVLDACPKAEGMMMLIRSMSPEVLVVDEIGRDEDVYAINEAINAGVQVIVTVHGYSFNDLKLRKNINTLLQMKVFDRFLVLSRESGPGTVTQILDKNGNEMNYTNG